MDERAKANMIARLCAKAQEELFASLATAEDGQRYFKGLSDETKEKLVEVGIDPDEYSQRLAAAKIPCTNATSSSLGVNRVVYAGVSSDSAK